MRAELNMRGAARMRAARWRARRYAYVRASATAMMRLLPALKMLLRCRHY